jgi:hypothetical protein
VTKEYNLLGWVLKKKKKEKEVLIACMGRKPQKKKKKNTCVKKRLQQHSFLVGFWFPQEAGCMDLSSPVLLTMELK